MGFQIACSKAHAGQPQHQAGLSEPSKLAALSIAKQAHGSQTLELIKLAPSAAKAASWAGYCCTWFASSGCAVQNQHM